MKFRWSFHAVFLLVFIFLLGVSFSNDTAINFLGNWSQSNPRIAESQHAEGLRSQDETVRLPSATDVAQHSATQNDELRSDLNSNPVQIVPLPSLATQILLNVNWQKTRDQGLRRVQLKPGAFLGPVAMRSFRGRLLFWMKLMTVWCIWIPREPLWNRWLFLSAAPINFILTTMALWSFGVHANPAFYTGH